MQLCIIIMILPSLNRLSEYAPAVSARTLIFRMHAGLDFDGLELHALFSEGVYRSYLSVLFALAFQCLRLVESLSEVLRW
jgi:hypothetical protein